MSSSYILVLESPNKIKKVQSYVGSNYNVCASVGHIRKLGKHNELGIDIDNNYAVEYINDENKQVVIANLKKNLRNSSNPKSVIIATDYDREGEAIGWHITQVLNIKIDNAPRLIFKEITKNGLLSALKSPSKLDMNMIYSQQARMVLDKLIGFKLCEVIHKYFKNYKLSAGRVQSVVAKLIIEREQEISKFKSTNYFKTNAGFEINDEELNKKLNDGKKASILSYLEKELTETDKCNELINIVKEHKSFKILDKSTNQTKRKPSPPYTTSSLQQDASAKLGMSPKVCMMAAQKLYENGLITYMRTDSLMLSDEFLNKTKEYIIDKFGSKYHKRTTYITKKKGAQEAHEACRPTDIGKESIYGIEKCGRNEDRLYKMIWKRSVASQMSPADIEINTLKIKRSDHTFISKMEKILFDGFLKIYNLDKANNSESNNSESDSENEISKSTDKLERIFKTLQIGDKVYCKTLNINEQESKPKHPRYTEASLVKMLEKLGIGRPSTYASMVDKIQSKLYVEKKNLTGENKEFYVMEFKYPNDITIDKQLKKVGADKNKLIPTDLGISINNYLEDNFDKFLDYDFTSSIELQLDDIAKGIINWTSVVDGVFQYLKPRIEKLLIDIKSQSGGGFTSNNKILLGEHPETKNNVYVIKTRKGWLICEENEKDKQKSRWGEISKLGKRHDKITLEDALKMLIYPYTLGKYNKHNIEVKKAKNIYLSYMGKNLSIEAYNKYANNSDDFIEINPNEITLTQAIDIIKYYEQLDRQKQINEKEQYTFGENKDIIVKKGPYGYYIKYLKMYNVALPKEYKEDVSELTEEVVTKCISKYLKNQHKSSNSGRGRKTYKK